MADSQLPRIAEHRRSAAQPTVLFDSNFAALRRALRVNSHVDVGKFVAVIHNQDGWGE
jgi:hypothetical protein